MKPQVEKVFFDDKRINADGNAFVRVKWSRVKEETYEPLEKMLSLHKRQPVANKKKDVGTASKKRKAPAPVAEEKETKIDYMSHSLMIDADAQAVAAFHTPLNENAAALSLTQAPVTAPALSRRNNASRARRENISIEEQINRSAEMRDLVAQDAVASSTTTFRAASLAAEKRDATAATPATVGTAATTTVTIPLAAAATTATAAAPSAVKTVASNAPKAAESVADARTNALYYSSTDDSDTNKTREQTSTAQKLFPYKRGPRKAVFIGSVEAVNKQQTPPPDISLPVANDALDNQQSNVSGTAMLVRHYASAGSRLCEAMRAERWEENSALENANDEGRQPTRGAHVCHSTLSTAMEERNYKAYGINSFFRDTQFAEDVELERKLMGVAVRNLCRANKEDDTNAEALARARQQIANVGLGRALVSVHSLCASAKQRRQHINNGGEPHNLTAAQFEYPLQTDIRCFYDHHRFTNIPIFIPLAFSSSDSETVSILSSVCFCSFSCAKSWIREKAPSCFRNDNADIMLTIFARKYFAMTENIKYAQSLVMHEDYGGPLNTRQWRAMGTTHHSILRQPLCVAAPSTIVAEVYVRSRKDAGKVARIVKRTEETHFNSVPERPERNSADAAEASKRKLKEGEGRPLKQRQTVDAQGNRITLDDEHLDQRIAAGAAARNAKRATQPQSTAKVTHIAAQAPFPQQTLKRAAAAAPVKVIAKRQKVATSAATTGK